MNEKLILDTSLFVNPASARAYGADPTRAFTRFLEMARETANVDFLMPPAIYAELMFFADEPSIPNPLLAFVHRQPPRRHETKVPGYFLYQLVEAMRDRIDRGLRLAERHVREALVVPPPPKGAAPKGEVRADAEIIGRLRDTYRRIMREGMLDSRADVDLLLLAYETGGILVSADQGVLDWAENLGIRLLAYDHLPAFLDERRRVKPS